MGCSYGVRTFLQARLSNQEDRFAIAGLRQEVTIGHVPKLISSHIVLVDYFILQLKYIHKCNIIDFIP